MHSEVLTLCHSSAFGRRIDSKAAKKQIAMLARTLTRQLLQSSRRALATRVAAQTSRLQHTQASDEDDTAEFRDLVRDFAAREVAPYAAEIDRNNAMPNHKNLWTEMGHMGLHGETHLCFICS